MKYLLGVSLVVSLTVGLTVGWPMENQYRGGFMAPVDFDFSRPGKTFLCRVTFHLGHTFSRIYSNLAVLFTAGSHTKSHLIW